MIKNQLQCRSHGQKYIKALKDLLSQVSIQNKRPDSEVKEQIEKHLENKRYLFDLYKQDHGSNSQLNFNFEDPEVEAMFLKSIPNCVKEEKHCDCTKEKDEKSIPTDLKKCISAEFELIKMLNKLKVDQNREKRRTRNRRRNNRIAIAQRVNES